MRNYIALHSLFKYLTSSKMSSFKVSTMTPSSGYRGALPSCYIRGDITASHLTAFLRGAINADSRIGEAYLSLYGCCPHCNDVSSVDVLKAKMSAGEISFLTDGKDQEFTASDLLSFLEDSITSRPNAPLSVNSTCCCWQTINEPITMVTISEGQISFSWALDEVYENIPSKAYLIPLDQLSV
jgi:hypothetical protein